MNALWDAFLSGAIAIAVAVTVLWLVSLWRRDVSIVDVFWGLGFVLVAWLYRFEGPPGELRQHLLLALVSVWGVRLAAYISWRGWGEGEDYRYRAMRESLGERFAWVSYFTVFLLQGFLICLISAPLLWVEAQRVEPGWRASDVAGLLVWGVGFFFEAVGDWQLARFKADPANRGKVLDRGLWALTRHPNYFGDAMVWWGFYLLALGAPGGVWTLPAPIVMTLLLLKVSGVALLEKTIEKRRPEYRRYVERTSAFIPWFPKKAEEDTV